LCSISFMEYAYNFIIKDIYLPFLKDETKKNF
jgi:hypothetical protein